MDSWSIAILGLLCYPCWAVAYAEESADPMSRRQLQDRHDAEVLLVFMFCGMFIGALVTLVLSRMKSSVPYTVVVFLVGVLLSCILDTTLDFGRFEDSVESWRDIDPELLLYLFLPALLFGEAMNLSW